ncbi:MAG: hypothetical protein H6604_09270 [Flavobacteriales bacterium]|nr:hypothetical protein [Flavobacteriales bacterium]
MKYSILALSLFSFLLFNSCSDSDESDNSNSNTENNNYVVLSSNSKWNYSYTENSNSENVIVEENGNKTIAGKSYTILNNGAILFAGGKNEAQIRKSGNQYIIYDTFSLTSDVSIPLEYAFLDVSKNVGETLSGNFSYTTEPATISQNGFSGTYTITTTIYLDSTMEEKLDTFTVLDTSYSDVLKVNRTTYLKVDLNVSGQYLGININNDTTIAEKQQIGTETMYFANNYGIIQSNSSLNFNDLNINNTISISGINFDISDYINPIKSDLLDSNIETECMLISYEK